MGISWCGSRARIGCGSSGGWNTPPGWQAAWGGAMQNVSTNPGVYGPKAWPGASPYWGASASSFSVAGGLITLEDLEKGVINHALAIGIPDVRAGVYASPAQRTDGTSASALSLPEGAHLRLEPGLDLAALHLPRLTLMMAEAAQRYGIYVREHRECLLRAGSDTHRDGTIRRCPRLLRREDPPSAPCLLPLEPPTATQDGTAQHLP